MPISHVTAAHSPSDVTVYDGSTYRDDVSNGAGNTGSEYGPHSHDLYETAGEDEAADDVSPVPASGLAAGILKKNTSYTNGAIVTNTIAYTSLSDVISHIEPRFHAKKRTMWSFARTVSAAAGFTHVIWADQIIGTSSHPPYRIGMTPTSVV